MAVTRRVGTRYSAIALPAPHHFLILKDLPPLFPRAYRRGEEGSGGTVPEDRLKYFPEEKKQQTTQQKETL